LLALALGLMTFAFAPGGKQGRGPWTMVRNAFIGIAAIVFLAGAAMRSELMRNRFEDTRETGSMAGREVLFPTLWHMFLEKPWTGWGQVNNQFELAQRIAEQNRLVRDSHNLVLEVLTTTGIVGAIPFFIALGLMTWAGWRARHGPHGITPTALLVFSVLGAMSGNPITNKQFWFILAYAVAAAVPIVFEQRDTAPAPLAAPLPLVRA